MIRSRFKVNTIDPRPVVWPIQHPYWVTGYDLADKATIMAYADNEEEILKNWPEATDIDSEIAVEYVFTGRFPKPQWFNNKE